jgi:RNA polymerase sigma-70 factor (ECF subfamily)
VQDALLRGHDQHRQLAAGKAPGPWLRAILGDHFLDRRRQAQSETPPEAAYAAMSPQVMEATQDSALRRSLLRQAFLDLADDQREALELIAVEGLSYAEAGALIGVPPGRAARQCYWWHVRGRRVCGRSSGGGADGR